MNPIPNLFLAPKTALVTGSSRGIGRAIALRLAEAGADVVVHYLRKKRAAHEVVSLIESMGRRAIAVKANLVDAKQIEAMFDQLEANFAPCDIFVGNAASGIPKDILAMRDKHWDWTMDINARSLLRCVKRVTPYMKQQNWGRIITLTSPGSRQTLPHYGPIGLSKAVVEALTRYLAVELASQGIIANAVSPGVVETDALSAFPINQQEYLEFARKMTPANRLTTPQDVANLVAFLCSDDASMIVGQTLTVDGGFGITMYRE
ncbi:SDR family oxidoreductase [Anaerolineales bacterium HSG6]|nr:SDR family oxidoreductase [Anaerolineales bacterium HSG6]MDM8532644.1 SDR family oxidoreductase [Anaerolineales bacterium HSG25]